MTVPPGISIAFDNSLFDDPITWTRIDNLDGVFITDVTITRGRPDERSKSSIGTATIKGYDTKGILDPTNSSGPYYGKLDPVKLAAITLWNPNTNLWNYIYRGYISDITLSFQTDLSKQVMDFEITLVDMLDLLNDSEIIPDSAGNMVPTENIGDSFYTGQHIDDRLLAVLADDATAFFGVAWPVNELQIASGNVFVQGRAYSNQTSLLQVIDEACDAEGPFATNRFITSDGQFAFRGRYYRYVPNFYTAFDGVRKQNHRMLQWKVADTQAYSVGSSMAIMSGFTFTRGKTNLINTSNITQVGIRTDEIAGQVVSDSTSIGKYGPRTSGMSLENLITDDADDQNTAKQETHSFAQAYVNNYKNPVTRVSQMKLTNPYNDTDDEGTNIWMFLCGVELSDLVFVYTHHTGGGGFGGVGHYVEQLTYNIQPLQGQVWQVELTVDMTPQAYYANIPHSWNPPNANGVIANFSFSVVGDAVTFTDTSTPGPSGPIIAWAWDFGDGNTSTTQNPAHTYASDGLWVVKLTVTGTGGDGTSSTFEYVVTLGSL